MDMENQSRIVRIKKVRANQKQDPLDLLPRILQASRHIYNPAIASTRNLKKPYDVRSYLDVLKRITSLRNTLGFENPQERHREDATIIYCLFVEPHFPLFKIKKCLKEFDLDENTIRKLLFILKPINIEDLLTGNSSSSVMPIASIQNQIKLYKQKIKQRAPLVKQLENLKQDILHKNFYPLSQTVDRIKKEINIYRDFLDLVKGSETTLFHTYSFDRNLGKNPQKQRYWNDKVSESIKIINQYSHNADCCRNCRKTHKKAIHKIAELLKLLYPSIWKEDIQTIADRIKQRNYRTE
jgi:hypothetical protein